MIACFEAIILSPDFDRIAKDIDVKNLQTGFGKPVLILHGDKEIENICINKYEKIKHPAYTEDSIR